MSNIFQRGWNHQPDMGFWVFPLKFQTNPFGDWMEPVPDTSCTQVVGNWLEPHLQVSTFLFLFGDHCQCTSICIYPIVFIYNAISIYCMYIYIYTVYMSNTIIYIILHIYVYTYRCVEFICAKPQRVCTKELPAKKCHWCTQYMIIIDSIHLPVVNMRSKNRT